MLRRFRQNLQIEESYLPETCPFVCKCPTVLNIGNAVEVKATPVAGASKEFLVALIVASAANSKTPLHSPNDLMKSPSSDDGCRSLGSSHGDDNNSDGRNSGCNSDSDCDSDNHASTTIALQLRPKLNAGSIQCSAGKISANQQLEESTVRLAQNPFAINRSFSLVLLVQQDCYQVIINGDHVMDFCHRVRAENVTHLLLDGDAIFEHVAFYSGLARSPYLYRSSSSIRRFAYSSQTSKPTRKFYKQQQQLSNILATKPVDSRNAVMPKPSIIDSPLLSLEHGQTAAKSAVNHQLSAVPVLPAPTESMPVEPSSVNEELLESEKDEHTLVKLSENSTPKPASQRRFIKASANRSKTFESPGVLMAESKSLRTLRPHTIYRSSSLRCVQPQSAE